MGVWGRAARRGPFFSLPAGKFCRHRPQTLAPARFVLRTQGILRRESRECPRRSRELPQGISTCHGKIAITILTITSDKCIWRIALSTAFAFVSDTPPEYRVGYRKPPRHSRFKKGQSGNPEGGRLHRPRTGQLVALLEAALDARMAARPRRELTRRQAIITGLVEKSAKGDLRAVKLLFDLVLKTELAAPPPSDGEEDPRDFLLRELARLAAAQAAEERGGTEPVGAGDEPALLE